MPSSYIDSIPPIVHLLTELQPKRICDVGPGWGKYGVLCREYLPELETLQAVEVGFSRQLNPTMERLQDAIYDSVLVRDVRLVRKQHWRNFDLVLMIDVIEHVEVPEGQAIIRDIIKSGARVLVSTPKQWFSQEDDPNPFERHRSLWDWTMFPPASADISTIDSLIFLVGGLPLSQFLPQPEEGESE